MKYTLYYAHARLKAVKGKRLRANTGIAHLSTAPTVSFISAPLILSLSGRSTGMICLFTPIALYSIFPSLEKGQIKMLKSSIHMD